MRVLKNNGKYVCVSRANKESRMRVLQKPDLPWTIKVINLPKTYFNCPLEPQPKEKSIPANCYLYECTKEESTNLFTEKIVEENEENDKKEEN